MKKDKRAEQDEIAQRDRNREQLLLLDQQMVKIRDSKQQEALLRQQEEELRVSSHTAPCPLTLMASLAPAS